jgi:hypothetical protein
VGLHCLILTVTWAQDGGAGRVVDPLGKPSSSPLQITFTRAPLDREIKKSEKKIPFHRPSHFLRSFRFLLTRRCSYFNRQDGEIFILAAVDRKMTVSVVNTGRIKHNITYVKRVAFSSKF